MNEIEKKKDLSLSNSQPKCSQQTRLDKAETRRVNSIQTTHRGGRSSKYWSYFLLLFHVHDQRAGLEGEPQRLEKASVLAASIKGNLTRYTQYSPLQSIVKYFSTSLSLTLVKI